MKVLVFNHSFFNISETFIYKQVTGQPADIIFSLMGFNFIHEDIFPLQVEKVKLEKQVNFIDKLLSTALWKIFGILPGFSVFNYFKVKKYLKKNRPDLIHVHFGFNALLVYPIARSLDIPMVVTFHGVDASPQYLRNKKYKERIKNLLEYAKGIIIVSPHMTGTLEASQWKSKTYLIPCCVDPSEFINDKSHTESKKTRILHSGRLVSKKGVPDLIKVCISLSKKYPNIQLDIIGDGPELALSRQLVKDAGADNIIFYGAKSHQEVRKTMAEADIFVLNSRVGDNGDMEGLPVSLLEAMSMNLPVVSTYHAGIPQAITNETDGLLVNEKDNAALESALERLITSPQLRLQLGKAARAKVESGFTIRDMNRKILEVYRSI